jgi:hypothetical protein
MFIHSQSKTIVLNVPDPLMVRDMVPKYSRLVDVPEGNIALKHTIDTTVLLRNLGFDVPSPVVGQYDWPGKHHPFDHQRVMADALTTHMKIFNLSEMGCVSGDTEYLTPYGWKRIDQYIGGQVAQYLPETGEIEFVTAEYVKLPCDNMIRFKTTRGVDQLLSPEHRVLLANGNVVHADAVLALYGRQDRFNRDLRFRTTFLSPHREGILLSDAELRLQIACNADGRFQANRVYIRLKKIRKIERLRALLVAAGIPYWEKPCEPEGFIKFSFEPPMSKGFTAEWWNATPKQINIIATEVIHWDGSNRKQDGWSFTGTKQDADFIQYVWSASGRRTTIRRDIRSADVWDVFAGAGDPTIGLYGRQGHRPANNVYAEPSPDGFKYCFMVPSTFLLLRRNGCIFATGNTGKTYASLWAADYLMRIGKVKRCLIVAPLSTLELIWMQDIFDILMHRTAGVVHGSMDHRMDVLRTDLDFYILNHDGIKLTKVAQEIRKRKDIDLVILDEASDFRNARSTRYKFLAWVLEKKERFWPITGTPMPNDPTDAWALARLVNPKGVPPFFGAFKRETMTQVTHFRWVPKRGAEQTVYKALRPAVRFKKADCLDLPPTVTINVQAQLTKEQRTAYDSMRDEMIIQFQQGDITAANAADQIGKLRQILLGALRDPTTGAYLPLDHAPRLAELERVIQGAAAKVLVVVPYKGIIRVLDDELRAKGYSCAVLNGDVTKTKRIDIVRAFKSGPSPHILLCHPKVMSHGLNLVEADVTAFYGPIYSNDQYRQVVERNNRTGQVNSMTIARIAAHPMEWEIYRMVDNKDVTQDSILSLYRQVTHE